MFGTKYKVYGTEIDSNICFDSIEQVGKAVEKNYINNVLSNKKEKTEELSR